MIWIVGTDTESWLDPTPIICVVKIRDPVGYIH